MKDIKKNQLLFIFIFVLGTCAALLMYFITINGPGVTPDSTKYFSCAENLLSLKGFYIGSIPMTRFPPFYPILLSLIAFITNNNIISAARILGACLYGINLLLFIKLIQVSLNKDLIYVIFAALLFLSSSQILSVHSYAWSEAPFISLFLLSFLFLYKYIENTESKLLLCASSLCIGLAIITRYVGITLLIPLVISLFFFTKNNIKERILNIIIALSISSAPLTIWFLRNIILAKTTAKRSFALHFFNLKHAINFINTMHGFIIPIKVSLWLKIVHLSLILFFFTIIIYFLNKSRNLVKDKNLLKWC